MNFHVVTTLFLMKILIFEQRRYEISKEAEKKTSLVLFKLKLSFQPLTNTRSKTLSASVRSDVCGKLFCMNWTSARAEVRGRGEPTPLSPRLKTQADCKIKVTLLSPVASAKLLSPPQSLTSPNMWSLPPRRLTLPSARLNSLFFHPGGRNKLNLSLVWG